VRQKVKPTFCRVVLTPSELQHRLEKPRRYAPRFWHPWPDLPAFTPKLQENLFRLEN
jgi:hypothetical protein